MPSHFLSSEIDNAAPDKAAFHVIPAPLEATVSYGGGAAGGPAAILAASDELELYDGISVPAHGGIYTAQAVDCHRGSEAALDGIQAAVTSALDNHALPVLLGGEHTVTLGALRALRCRYPNDPLGVLQFDAHADLRDEYGGTPLSHACVMRRALELGYSLAQYGVRALSLPEAVLRRKAKIFHLDARTLAGAPEPEAVLPENFPRKVYVTFDVDGLDPAVIRATGTPVPGGLGWHQALRLAERALAGHEVLGLDVTELAPQPQDCASDFAAAQLVYCLMGLAARSRG